MLSTGQIGSATYFPSTKASGLEFGASMAYAFGSGFDVRLLGNFTSYTMKFTTAEGATYIATSATDRQIGLSAAVRYTY